MQSHNQHKVTKKNDLVLPHGGYRKLKSFQVSRLVYDLTVRFCDRFIDRYSRTRDQMVQAARSGVQNIAEGSQAAATSKKTEIKLTSVARSSLEELLLDYEDFLRHHKLPLWDRHDPRRCNLIESRLQTIDALVCWAENLHNTQATPYSEIAANAAHALICVATALLNRQIETQTQHFKHHGGFTENLFHQRQKARKLAR